MHLEYHGVIDGYIDHISTLAIVGATAADANADADADDACSDADASARCF